MWLRIMCFVLMRRDDSIGSKTILARSGPRQYRPIAVAAHTSDGDTFTAVDLYLIADFGPGEYEWAFKKHHFDVVEDLE